MLQPKKFIEICFCILFILVPLVFLPQTSELFEFNKIIITYVLTVIITGSWLIRMVLEKKIIFRRTVLDLPLLLFLFSNFLSLIFSIDPHMSFFGYYSRFNGGLLSLICYALLYWSYVSNMDSGATLKVIKCALFAAVPISIWAALEHFGFSPACLLTTGKFNVSCWVQDVQNRVFATLGQPNWLAAYIVALIFVPLSYLTLLRLPSPSLGEGSRVRYWLSFGIFILLFLTLLFTKSRSGLLAFGISSLVFWVFARKLKLFVIFSILVLILTLGIKNPIRDLVFKTPAPEKTTGPALEVGGTESGSIRKIVWTGAIRIWLANPKNFILGTGPETFAESYYQYRPLEHNQTSEWELLYNKAHNEFLNYLANTGVLGLGAYLLLLGTMATVYLSPFRSPSPESGEGLGVRYLIISLLCGWLTISITNFWGFSVVITQIFLFLFPAIAICLNE